MVPSLRDIYKAAPAGFTEEVAGANHALLFLRAPKLTRI
jgi:hypothetical protein